MNNFSVNMKKSIDNALPECQNELSYIVEQTGYILFTDSWEDFKPSQLQKPKKCNILYGIVNMINNQAEDNYERNELLNYLFSSSLNKLTAK